MNFFEKFKQIEFMEYNDYKEHIDFLDDLYFKQHMMRKAMGKI
jgi:hypothetical protein